jgi:hypothetical protein
MLFYLALLFFAVSRIAATLGQEFTADAAEALSVFLLLAFLMLAGTGLFARLVDRRPGKHHPR